MTLSQHPDEERDMAELDTLLDELVSEARDIERYANWDLHARAEAESRQGVDEALAKIRATFTTLRQQLTEAQADKIDALEQAACIADEHWTESGHVPKPGAVSCAMSISIMIRRLKSPPAALASSSESGT